MMNAQVWGQMFLLFGYVIVGYICNKLHIFDERTNGKLSGFLLKVAIAVYTATKPVPMN